MPIHPWTKQRAILITKTARYIVPAVIAAVGAAAGFITGLFVRKKTKRAKRPRTK